MVLLIGQMVFHYGRLWVAVVTGGSFEHMMDVVTIFLMSATALIWVINAGLATALADS